MVGTRHRMRSAFKALAVAVLFSGCSLTPAQDQGAVDSIPAANTQAGPLSARISPPAGFKRMAQEAGSFAAWLRELPLRPGRSTVYLYDSSPKWNQSLHHAVLDIDVGSKDLQQCADAVIRLRAEYLYSTACSDEIAFNFTSGDAARWAEWKEGMRPRISGNHVSWTARAAADGSYESFRRYLDTVFTYAGSASLQKELEAVSDPLQVQAGDIFIQGGFPGHAVIVMDVAQDESGAKAFLLAQSYMPAQDIHILKSFSEYDPWYPARSEGILRTPEWTFDYRNLKRFRPSQCESRLD